MGWDSAAPSWGGKKAGRAERTKKKSEVIKVQGLFAKEQKRGKKKMVQSRRVGGINVRGFPSLEKKARR